MITKNESRYACGRGSLLVACAGCFAASTSAAGAELPEGVLQEIIVTAQKREERLQDVPFTVNVLTEATIVDANIVEFEDMAALTPGLEFATSLGRQTGSIVIRGLAPAGFTSEDTTLVYVDGFTLGFSRVQNNAQYFDLERIEVLKGPQGTLYGRNAIGGVINMITKKPGDEFEGWVKASYGNYDAYELAGSLSGPVASEWLSMGVAARHSERDGFWDNLFTGEKRVNGESDEAAQFQLRATPSERARVDLTLSYGESDDECGNCPNSPVPGFSPTDRQAVGRGQVDFNSPADTVNQDLLGGFDRQTWTAVLNGHFDLGSVALDSITGYADTDATVLLDFNSAPGPLLGVLEALSVRRTSTVLSQELRLSSDSDGRLQWIAGLFGFTTDLGRHSTVFLTPPLGSRLSTDADTTVKNYAAFGNVEYALSHQWSLGLGLRWDYERVELEDRLAPIRLRNSSGDELLPKISFSYRPNTDLNLYVSAARGYRAGGFNNFTEQSVPPEFDAEYVWHYEAGLKGTASQGRLRYELAAYHIDWMDRHRQLTTPGGQDFIVNFGSAAVTGLEGSTSMILLPGLTVEATVALTDSEIKDFLDTTAAPSVFGWDPDYSGNSLPFTPDVAVTLSGQYIRSLGSAGWELRVRTDARYTGEREFHESGVPTQDPHTIVNAYLGIQNERWQLGVFADNLFDAAYHSSGEISPTFGPWLVRGDPRTYGVRMRAHF